MSASCGLLISTTSTVSTNTIRGKVSIQIVRFFRQDEPKRREQFEIRRAGFRIAETTGRDCRSAPMLCPIARRSRDWPAKPANRHAVRAGSRLRGTDGSKPADRVFVTFPGASSDREARETLGAPRSRRREVELPPLQPRARPGPHRRSARCGPGRSPRTP